MEYSRRYMLISGAAVAAGGGAYLLLRSTPVEAKRKFPYQLTDAQWRKRLSPAAYRVLRQEGTERAFTSPLDKQKRQGVFKCAGCNNRLFSSKHKYDSKTGWPSFYRALPGATGKSVDYILRYARTEVHCARCGGHLGHVFNDGPKPTGKRWCINGVALKFVAGG